MKTRSVQNVCLSELKHEKYCTYFNLHTTLRLAVYSGSEKISAKNISS